MNDSNLQVSKNKRQLNNTQDIIIDKPTDKGSFNDEHKAQMISEGAKLAGRVMDIVHLREQTDASLKTIDKQIELVERTTAAEIEKLIAQTDNWEKRFLMVSKVLQEMTITVTTNKDLDPQVAKALIDTVRTMVDKMAV
jgi:hypothetical protein